MILQRQLVPQDAQLSVEFASQCLLVYRPTVCLEWATGSQSELHCPSYHAMALASRKNESPIGVFLSLIERPPAVGIRIDRRRSLLAVWS